MKVQVHNSRFPKWGQHVGGEQFGQNGKKLHENYKINMFGVKQWGEGGGHGRSSQIFSDGGHPLQSPPPTRGLIQSGAATFKELKSVITFLTIFRFT